MRSFLVLLFLIIAQSVSAQAPFWHPSNLHFSNEADIGIYPCPDTLKIYGFKHVVDIGLILPAWRPVLHKDTVTILEGLIMPIEGHLGYKFGVPHVSFEDLPLYHYTHDFSFNVFPDSGYRNVLSRYIHLEKDENGEERKDTIVREWVHCEMESGLAAANRGNKHAEACRKGGTAGFASVGHERHDVIWNWPTAGDWVHVEGQWVWDRGHPPAKTEIHPIRLMATRRNLPDRIRTSSGDSVFATRVDIYANGDGSAFHNNQDTGAWASPVKMDSKDYSFQVLQTLPRPSKSAQLKCFVVPQKGNTYQEKLELNATVVDGEGRVQVTIPWRSTQTPRTAVLGQSLYLYWDEDNGVSTDYHIHTYTITLEKLKIKRLSEIFFLTPAELRMFADVGGQYIFLNEHVTKNRDILCAGMGRTIRKHWKINKSFTIHVPDDRQFRVYAGGWEADGAEKVMGRIVNQNAGCSTELKQQINNLMLDPTPVGYGGCEDDNMGEAINFHSPQNLNVTNRFISTGDGEPYQENCPLGSRTPVDFFELEYSIIKK